MTDLISRADVLEGLKHSTAYLHDDIYTIVNRIPSAETTGALDEAIAKYVADGYMLPPSGGLISRADAIDAVAEEWLSEASAESPYVNDYDIDRYRELAEELFADIPSAELTSQTPQTYGKSINPSSAEVVEDIISRADAIDAVVKVFTDTPICPPFVLQSETIRLIMALPSADAEAKRVLQGCCKGANAIHTIRHEELTQIANTRKAVESADAEQVTSKLKNPCDSLLTDDSADAKEQKSKLESAEVAPRIDHDRDWIIGCIEHDEFIHTHRFDKANQIILEALLADAVQGEWIEKGGELVCSVCGNSVSFSRTPKGWVLGKFCQSCGARMGDKR